MASAVATPPVAAFTGETVYLHTEETPWGYWTYYAEVFTGEFAGLQATGRFRTCNVELVADNGDGCAIVAYYTSIGD